MKGGNRLGEQQIILKVIDYIEEHLQEKLNLDMISAQVNYSKFHFNRLFSEKVGYTVYKYIQMRRLTIAAQELVSTNKSIVDIAYEAGYCSQQAFTFAFKQVYLDTPQVYRTKGIFLPKQLRFTRETTMYHIYQITNRNYQITSQENRIVNQNSQMINRNYQMISQMINQDYQIINQKRGGLAA